MRNRSWHHTALLLGHKHSVKMAGLFFIPKKGIMKMKKHSRFFTVFLIAALCALVMPTSASANQEPVGVRIGFWAPPGEFAAGAPFNIRHGWVQTSDDEAIGIFDFRLEIDGVVLREDFKMFSAESGSPDTLTRMWVYNFPDGMTGSHTFTGHWYASCQYAVDNLEYPGPCATPNDKVETRTRTMTINFVP